jgi:tetratricopeptide (TPR) repeat protein
MPMKTFLFAVVIVLGVHLGSNFVAFSQEVDPLSEGNKLFQARNFEAAAAVYRRIVSRDLDIPTKAKAWFNLGVTYQRLRRYDDATKAFTKIFGMNVNDREQGGHLMEPYRNYRPRAQWLIGRILFLKGDYKGALEAYQTARLKYPVQSWCNVERNAARHRYALHEGLTYEHLGLYTEAVNSYLSDYVPRVAELYEASGQLDDLKRFLDKKDEKFYNSAGELAREKFSREEMKKYYPTHRLRAMLKLYELAHSDDWPALVRRLRKDSGMGGHDLVIRVLARYPDKTVPLLKEELGRPEIYQEFVYKALGLAGTTDAVAALKSMAEKDGSERVFALVHALSVAGEPGEKALAELDRTARNTPLRIAIDQYKSGELQETNELMRFPPIPANLRLPKEF